MSTTETRLRKVVGQLGAIAAMIERGEDCEKVFVQFQAAKGALESAFAEHLNTNLDACIARRDRAAMKRIVALLAKR